MTGGRIAIAHVGFLLINLFIVIDFWQVDQKEDKITDIQQKAVYLVRQTKVHDQTYGTYEVQTNRHLFEVSEKYIKSFQENSVVTVYRTQFLHIIRSVEIAGQAVPVAFWLYVAFAFLVAAIAAVALFISKSSDFRSFAAIINGLLSLMVVYLIWF